MAIFDVIVIGLGAMGSSAVDHLARRGLDVLGLDQFDPPHNQGSSYGQTRMIREAYFEHPAYVPIVQRAYELWDELETDYGQQLFIQTGALMIGPAEGALVQGSETSALQHGLAYEKLSAQAVKERYPALTPTADMMAIFESRAGLLFLEDCIRAHLQRAKTHGAQLHVNQTVNEWRIENGISQVETTNGTYSAKKILFTAGAWIGQLVPELSLPCQIERQLQFWFEPKHPEPFQLGKFPGYMIEDHQSPPYLYGFPTVDEGKIKTALHHGGQLNQNADSVDRDIHPEDVEAVRQRLEKYLPDANGELVESVVCLYTNTPDEHFLLDHHPHHPEVLIASPCSGHGFKFSSVIGEIVADLLTDQTPKFNLDLFKLDRF